jgi:DNA (cytosine-5)-methyltransferase 1
MTYEVIRRVVHDTSGLYSQGDITDRPCPAITIGVNGLNSAHYQVEYYLTDNPLESERNARMNKPPYLVPSMAEIAAIPWNGFNAVSTFSGCGGSSLGYKMAGFRVLWANEFIPAAQDTYRANHPGTILDTRDIRTVQPADVLEAIGMQAGELDLLDGSPPCASFSTAGKREAGWGKVKAYSDTKQRTDDLFFEYTRLLQGIQPKTFVAENVSGLVKGTAKGYFLEILAALKECGYTVTAKLLDAQWLGVPQMRQRVIFVGVRNDLVAKYGVKPAHPKPLGYRYSVRDALPWIVKHGEEPPHADWVQSNRDVGVFMVDSSQKPCPTILQSGENKGAGYVEARIIHDEGGQWSQGDITDEPAPTGRSERAGTMFVESTSRAYLDKRGAFGNEGDITDQPAPTVLSGSVGTHWIVGVGTHGGERAVPPVMMKWIALAIRTEILDKCKP